MPGLTARDRFQIPDVIDPPNTICLTMTVPDDPIHIANLLGALYGLCFGPNYTSDNAHSATELVQVWRRYYSTIKLDNCPVPGDTPLIDEYEDEMSLCEQLRFQNGVLQAYCCGKWEDITGQPSQGIGGGGQPGAGSPQPAPGGGCQDYQGNMGGAAPWYLPTSVSTGDTIDVHDISGAFYDAFNSRWFCPDGSEFFVTCIGISFTDSGSQMPTVSTGRLIAKIGSVYYDVQGSTFTVPGGHTNDPVQFEMNTPTPAGSGGNVAFTVTVCNNQAGSWSHVFDFTTNPYTAFFSLPTLSVFPGPLGIYTPGIGYTATVQTETGGTNFRGIYLRCLANANLTLISTDFDFTVGVYTAGAGDSSFAYVYYPGPVTQNNILIPTAPTSPQVDSTPFTFTQFDTQIVCGQAASPTDPGGIVTLKKMTLAGVGVDPFI